MDAAPGNWPRWGHSVGRAHLGIIFISFQTGQRMSSSEYQQLSPDVRIIIIIIITTTTTTTTIIINTQASNKNPWQDGDDESISVYIIHFTTTISIFHAHLHTVHF